MFIYVQLYKNWRPGELLSTYVKIKSGFDPVIVVSCNIKEKEKDIQQLFICVA